jgi:hypothetical protein
MSGQLLSPDQVSILESAIDKEYQKTRLPTREKNSAIWATLSVSEDYFRTVTDARSFLEIQDSLPMDLRSGEHLNVKISHELDSGKFALRQALDLLRTTLEQETDPIDYTFHSDQEKTDAFVLFEQSKRYAEAHRQFLSYHKRISHVLKHHDGSVQFVEPPEAKPYRKSLLARMDALARWRSAANCD